MPLIAELKRRNVFRVAVAYTVAGWLLVQVGDIASESFEAPAWIMKMLITALVAGFPLVIFFSWAFEITPEGIKREKDIDRGASITATTGHKLNTITITLLILVIALVGIDRFLPRTQAPARPVAQPAEAGPGAPEAGSDSVSATADKAPDPAASAVTSDRNSIAVLPFVNMSDDPAQDYFSDGIAEELLNLLAKVDGLKVASRTSAFAYKGSSAKIPEIARQLKVTNVLEGSVRKAGNRVRITAQLIDTSQDRHLWSESYDRELDDIFAIQDEIASAIVDALTTELGIELNADKASVKADTDNMNAYELFLRGRGLVMSRTKLTEAASLLQRAVELDPQFARAWTMLALTYNLIPSWNVLSAEDDERYYQMAIAAIDRSLAIDPEQSLGLATKGMLLNRSATGVEWEYALELLDRAIALDPNEASALLFKGIRLSELGYQQPARELMERCLQVDPAYLNCTRHLARLQWIMGDKEAATATYADVVRRGFTGNDALFAPILFPQNTLAQLMATSYLGQQDPGFPVEEWLQALEHPEQDHSAALPRVLDWVENDLNKPIGAEQHVLLLLGAWDHLRLDLAYVNNWIWLPGYPGFRDSPHFQRLIRDFGLPGYWDRHGPPPGCTKTGEEYRCE